MLSHVTVNPDQKLYVIPCGDGYTCFGFDNAQRHTLKILASVVAQERGHFKDVDHPSVFEGIEAHPLNFTSADYGQISGYEKYQQACKLWSAKFSDTTYFDPFTAPEVIRLLEQYRRSRHPVRIFLGDSETGRDWMEENDVVGTIGRSSGSMKVPLLVPQGEDGGGAILTACVLRIIDATTLKQVYAHSKYQPPALAVHPDTSVKKYTFRVDRDDEVQARFRTREQAFGYVAFMLGAAVKTSSLH